ncbi:uncharacterized protein BO87DRAFT_423847 [Aspergillus neoniger CBS 115656]|uniref:DUF6314 domain-containing protein n=1 Tax=Aspergillus neoniger (strain CBS 115656) TaxID=1448310 RepID=A0A318YQD6_ASPNB|nr:hypothetical protein BO87DRAFT_423847 [Aspergillus neoniger CBS 115656]PYH36871.1 hypothetical protein BO87DRAFT_423847 [Aspergillus neoniger CBS 115656]
MTTLNLNTLFTSLPTKNWTLLRVLKSANPHDINGNLHGTASFTSLPDTTQDPPSPQRQLLYTETGTLPPHIGHNLQWKKSYIWRLKPSPSTATFTPTVKDDLSVWFVKVGDEKVADYLFHGMEFLDNDESGSGGDVDKDKDEEGEEFVSAPVPPPATIPGGEGRGKQTVVVTARGNHLCINDMYRTAYAFRVVKTEDDSDGGDGDGDGIGEVVSWASRHVVKGPKKDQDIVNYYTVREGV